MKCQINISKVIFVCRNPLDCCVSYYHHVQLPFSAMRGFGGGFADFANMFRRGKTLWGDYWYHLEVNVQ